MACLLVVDMKRGLVRKNAKKTRLDTARHQGLRWRASVGLLIFPDSRFGQDTSQRLISPSSILWLEFTLDKHSAVIVNGNDDTYSQVETFSSRDILGSIKMETQLKQFEFKLHSVLHGLSPIKDSLHRSDAGALYRRLTPLLADCIYLTGKITTVAQYLHGVRMIAIADE